MVYPHLKCLMDIGINHPVINHETGKGEITSQNHGFAVDRKALESDPNIIITHSHLNDNTVAGLNEKQKKFFLFNITRSCSRSK